MANVLSDNMTNVLDRSPTKSANVAGVDGAIVRAKRAVVVIPSTAGAGTIFPLFRVSAFDRLITIWWTNTADAGMTDVDIRVYAGAADGLSSAGNWNSADQTAITAGILSLGNDFSLASGQIVVFTNSVPAAIPLATKELWELCGVASRPQPGTVYDIAVLANTNPAGCTITCTLEYSSDN